MSPAAKSTLGIVVGGGPAPGINSVISSATIEAVNCGQTGLGIYDGFKWLVKGDASKTIELKIPDISRIHTTGGSILKTSRENPMSKPDGIANVIGALSELGVDYLVVIGGDDTALSAYHIGRQAQGVIKVAHVPKTIDNDLPLPENISTFGFQSARHAGTYIVQSLMEDARTTGRWYLTVTMGRRAGFLALGIGFAAGATLSVIPEEFPPGQISFKHIADIIEGAMIKRTLKGKNYGVVILAEGLAENIIIEEGDTQGAVEKDEFGHSRLSEFDLGKALKEELKKRLSARGQKITIVDKEIGYELRSCAPIPFDIDYTRRLGYGAVRYLLGGGNKGLVCYRGGLLNPIPLEELFDKKTGRLKARQVDVKSEYYQAAYSYMIRLREEDFRNEKNLEDLAKATGMSAENFESRFGYLAKDHTK